MTLKTILRPELAVNTIFLPKRDVLLPDQELDLIN